LIQAYVDPEKLKTILTEVFDNAIYFMSNSGVLVVHISIEKRSHPAEPTNIQPWVRVNVIDSGPGIPEDHLRKVFEPYVTTRGERRGLGLAMVHAVVEAMHGWVDIHSRRGMGTTVSLYLRPAQEPPQ
jgi:signal transduction histidine kinase